MQIFSKGLFDCLLFYMQKYGPGPLQHFNSLMNNTLKSHCILCFTIIDIVLSYCSDQAEARRAKNKAAKQRREERLELKKKEMISAFAKEEEAAAK